MSYVARKDSEIRGTLIKCWLMSHLQSNTMGLADTGPTWSEAVMMEEAVDTEPLHARTRRLKKITN